MNARSLNTRLCPGLSSLALGLFIATFGTTAVYADDGSGAKLEELKRAMTAPNEGGGAGIGGTDAKKKVRTRAIVFDNEPQQQEAAPQGAAKQGLAKVARPADCKSLPADVKANAVDFSIQFKVASAEISHASESTLNEIAKILSLSPDRCVLVEGHTDASGSTDKNQVLSQKRADSVVKYITDKGGVDHDRIVPVGKGSSDPIKDLDPRDPKNRRVVFKVVAG
ncbi:MAG: OmpA family protein [Sterolibacterium sp.]|nr:OmpA family protein [Sterolibacterium sp.]